MLCYLKGNWVLFSTTFTLDVFEQNLKYFTAQQKYVFIDQRVDDDNVPALVSHVNIP